MVFMNNLIYIFSQFFNFVLFGTFVEGLFTLYVWRLAYEHEDGKYSELFGRCVMVFLLFVLASFVCGIAVIAVGDGVIAAP